MNKNIKAALIGLTIIGIWASILLINMFVFVTLETLPATLGYPNLVWLLLAPDLIFLFIGLILSTPVFLVEKIIGTHAYPPSFLGGPLLNIPDFLIDIAVIGIIAACVSIAISTFNQRSKNQKL